MSRNPLSLLYVFIQALLLAYLFLSGSVLPENILVGIILLAGVLLGLWAIMTMKITAVQITADVAPDANLITDGPYEFIRHPMYTAVLIVAAGLIINDYTVPRLLAFILLTFDLLLKASYEERLLVKYFKKGYEDYKKKTKRFIPFIW